MIAEPVTVRLHGPLADRYGPEHRFMISTPREAIAALEANHPGFRRDFLAIPEYGLLVDGDWRDATMFDDVAAAPAAREIDFCPMIEGRFFAPIVAGLTALGVGTIAANVLAGVITIGLLLGVSMLLAPKPKKKTSDDADKNENYMFSGPENVTEQGVAVPVIYGQVFTGSVVISAGLEVAEGLGVIGGSWTWRSLPPTATEVQVQTEPPPALPAPPPTRSRRYIPGNA